MSEFALSPEELALVFSLIGRPEAGQRLMAAQLGEISEAEARARLLAAGHSLIARGWMALSNEGPVLNEDLARAAHLLARADFSLRYSRATSNAEFNLAYHFSQDAVLEHRLEQGVVHRLNDIADVAAVVKGGVVFFGLPQAEPFQCPPATLQYSLLNELKNLDDPAQIDRRLQGAGIAEEIRPLLAEDLARPQYRGSALRVQYDAQGNLFSEKGFLLLHGPRRLWLITLSGPDPAIATLSPATVQAFSQQVMALLHP